MTKRTKLIATLAVVVVAICVIVGSYILLNTRGSEGGTPPIVGTGELTISDPPALNQTATLTYKGELGPPGTRIFVVVALEDGLVWIDDNIPENRLILENRFLVENVIMPENGLFEISGMIKSIKTGRWSIGAYATDYTELYPGIYLVGNFPFYDLENHHVYNVPYGSAGVKMGLAIDENSARMEYYFSATHNVYSSTPAPQSAFGIRMNFLEAPVLDSVVDLRCEVWSSVKGVPDATVQIDLPNNFVLADGGSSQTVVIPAGSQTESTFKVKMVELDNCWIRARVESQSLGVGSWDALYVSVGENGMISVGRSGKVQAVSQARKLDKLEIPLEYQQQNDLSGKDGGALNSPPGMITISGQFLYYDLEVGHDLPVKFAKVQIFDVEYWPIVGRHLQLRGENFTDQFGNFSFGPIPNDDSDTWDNGNGLDIVVYFVADTSKVKVMNAAGETYEENTPDYPDRSGDLDIGTFALSDGTFPQPEYWHVRAWRLFEYVNEAHDWLANPPALYSMDKIDVYYPMDNTWYLRGDRRIEVMPAHADSSFPVQHEYGHFVMHKVYDWWWPSYPEVPIHYVYESYSQGLAWVEGWADFFPLAVRNSSICPYLNTDFETDPSRGSWWDEGDTVEGRVAGALWDLYDSQNDGYDTISCGFGPIWNVLLGGHWGDFGNFFAYWRYIYYYGDEYMAHFAKLALYQNTITYNYAPSCTITPISGWQTPPITLRATALDQDWEDGSYLSVTFEYSRNGSDWTTIDTVSVPPDSPNCYIVWSPTFYDDSVWVRARTSDGMEYSGYSTTGPFGIAQSLVGYWPFDEGSGTVAHDESGYGNNGTIYSVQWVIGRVENALLFRGGYVGVPNSSSLQILGYPRRSHGAHE